MSVTLRSIILAALLMICASIMYRLSQESETISEEELSSRYPTFVADNFSGDLFESDGKLQYSIFSQNFAYYRKQDLIQGKKLVGFFYDHKNPNNAFTGWQILADYGEIILDKEAYLRGNVRAQPNYASSEIKEITTPALTLDIPNHTISSTESITIKGSQFINTGRNYFVDLSKKSLVIKENPHATYYPDPSYLDTRM